MFITETSEKTLNRCGRRARRRARKMGRVTEYRTGAVVTGLV